MLFGHQDGGLGPTDKSIFCKSSLYFRAGPSVFFFLESLKHFGS